MKLKIVPQKFPALGRDFLCLGAQSADLGCGGLIALVSNSCPKEPFLQLNSVYSQYFQFLSRKWLKWGLDGKIVVGRLFKMILKVIMYGSEAEPEQNVGSGNAISEKRVNNGTNLDHHRNDGSSAELNIFSLNRKKEEIRKNWTALQKPRRAQKKILRGFAGIASIILATSDNCGNC